MSFKALYEDPIGFRERETFERIAKAIGGDACLKRNDDEKIMAALVALGEVNPGLTHIADKFTRILKTENPTDPKLYVLYDRRSKYSELSYLIASGIGAVAGIATHSLYGILPKEDMATSVTWAAISFLGGAIGGAFLNFAIIKPLLDHSVTLTEKEIDKGRDGNFENAVAYLCRPPQSGALLETICHQLGIIKGYEIDFTRRANACEAAAKGIKPHISLTS